MSKVPNEVFWELQNVVKSSLWKTSNPKIKCETLCKIYAGSGLKKYTYLNRYFPKTFSSSMLMDEKFVWWELS